VTDPKFPEDLRYTKSHEWIRSEGSDLVVGITDFAQGELTDIVFVDLPAVGKVVAAEASALVLESVKTVTDVYAPVAGTVSASNPELKSHPELVNKDPYGRGWIYRLTPMAPWDPAQFLDAAGYRAVVAGPSH
jgi:glycine cleavage system H protein